MKARGNSTRAPAVVPVSMGAAQVWSSSSRLIASCSLVALALVVVSALVGCEKKETKEPLPARSTQPVPHDAGAPAIETVEVPEVRIQPSATTTVRVGWVTPKGTAVNDEAPFRVRWNRSDGLAEAPADVKSTGSAVKDGFSVLVHPMAGAPNASLTGEINIVICDAETHSVCVPVRRTVELGFVVAKDAAPLATVSIPLPEARAAK